MLFIKAIAVWKRLKFFANGRGGRNGTDLLAKEMLRLTASADIFLKLSADDLFQLSKSEAAATDDTCCC